MIGSTVLLFVVCRLANGRRQQHFALRRPAAINLALEDHGILYARPHGLFQPATGSLVPSDQSTNLSQQFES